MSRESFLEREIASLKESRAFVEKSRDEAMGKVRDLGIQNQELILQMKKLKLIDTTRLSGIESELKLKKFELERCALLLSESEENYKKVWEEKEKLLEKLDVVKDEFTRVKCESEQKICTLQLKMRDKSTRLGIYEKLEKELDKVVLQAASLPDGCDTNKLLTSYGYGLNIPCNAKRRLEHSITLARRVMELEHQVAELKSNLYKERDSKNILQEELILATTYLKLSGYPTSDLLKLITKRDAEIRRHTQELNALKLEINSMKEVEAVLRKDVGRVEAEKINIENTMKMVKTKDECGVRDNSENVPPNKNKLRVTFKMEQKLPHQSSESVLWRSKAKSIPGIFFTKPLTLTKIPIPMDLMPK